MALQVGPLDDPSGSVDAAEGEAEEIAEPILEDGVRDSKAEGEAEDEEMEICELRMVNGHGTDMCLFVRSCTNVGDKSQVLVVSMEMCKHVDTTPKKVCEYVWDSLESFLLDGPCPDFHVEGPVKGAKWLTPLRKKAREYRNLFLADALPDDVDAAAST